MYNNSDELVLKLNAVESTCAVEFYTVVDTSRSPVHNNPCLLHWVRDRYHQLLHHCHDMLEEDQTNSPLGQITEGCCKKAVHYVKHIYLHRKKCLLKSFKQLFSMLQRKWEHSQQRSNRHLHHHHMLSRMTGYLSSFQEDLFEKCSEAIISLHPNN